jgi:hypothetical protein
MSRKLKEDAKAEIRAAFRAYGGSGVPEEALLRMCADHAIGLLELGPAAAADLYEEPEEGECPDVVVVGNMGERGLAIRGIGGRGVAITVCENGNGAGVVFTGAPEGPADELSILRQALVAVGMRKRPTGPFGIG